MNKSTRTQIAIMNRIESLADSDIFGFQTGDLVSFLDYDHAKPFIKADTTPEEWAEVTKGITSPAQCITEYMAFAWDKANNRRGISAGRSIAHMVTWLWLDGKDELAKQIEDYDYYGKPQLVAVCNEYGIDWKQYDDGEWVCNEDDTPRTAEEVLA
jgi:hypothetical protein